MHYFLNPDGETYTKDWETKSVRGTLYMFNNEQEVYECTSTPKGLKWGICEDPNKRSLMQTTRLLMT